MYLFIERTIVFREMLIGTSEASQEMQRSYVVTRNTHKQGQILQSFKLDFNNKLVIHVFLFVINCSFKPKIAAPLFYFHQT